jgi:hypothetical protein
VAVTTLKVHGTIYRKRNGSGPGGWKGGNTPINGYLPELAAEARVPRRWLLRASPDGVIHLADAEGGAAYCGAVPSAERWPIAAPATAMPAREDLCRRCARAGG